MRVFLNAFLVTKKKFFFSKMSIVKYRITTYYTRRGIWLCYFTHKLYLHSPSAHENMTLLVK